MNIITTKILSTILLTCLMSNCKAQTPILELFSNSNYAELNGAYYKDIENFRNQYVGTWLFIDGNTTLKLVLINKNQIQTSYGDKVFFEDFLVGEYQYIENGIEKVNTLNAINANYGNEIKKYNLESISCIKYPSTYPKCNECLPNEKRLRMTLTEPAISAVVSDFANSFILRAYSENGIQKLKVWFLNESKGMVFDKFDQPTNIDKFSLPFGQYILTKQ